MSTVKETTPPVSEVVYNPPDLPETPMRANIRKFVKSCASRFSLEEPIVDIASGYRNNYPEIRPIYGRKDPLFAAFDHTLNFNHGIIGRPPDFIADAQIIPFASGRIGTVICTEALEHIRDDHKTLSEISRILKPGGILY